MKSLAAWMIVCLALASASRADDNALAEHLQRLSLAMQPEIDFREEHHNAMLKAPAVYEGRLAYRTEDRSLIKEIRSPEQARMVVTDDAITMESDGRRRRLSLRKRPELRAMLGGFRALIEGDPSLLEEQFDVQFRQSAEGDWDITLTPLSRRLSAQVSSVIIDGHGDRVAGICTRMSNGDWQYLELIRHE